MKIAWNHWLTCGALVALLASPALADLKIEMVSRDLGSSSEETNLVQIAGKDVRIDIRNSGRQDTSVIFDGETDIAYILDHDAKSYTEIDKETMARLGGQINDAMAQMREQLKNLPPEQRAMMEQMLQGQMSQAMNQAAAEVAVTDVRATSRSGEQAGYACKIYEVYRESEKVSEVCSAEWGRLDGGQELQTAAAELQDFAESMMDALGELMEAFGGEELFQELGGMFANLDAYNGFPVQTRHFEAGEVDREDTLKSIDRADVSPSAFELPSDYRRQSLQEQGGA